MDIKYKTVIFGGITCIVQAYAKGEFVNLCPLQNNPKWEDVIGTTFIRFDGGKPTFFTGERQTEAWQRFVASIELPVLEEELEILFPEDKKKSKQKKI